MSPKSTADVEPENDTDILRFYGRRKGKRLHVQRQTAYDELMPKIGIQLPEAPAKLSPRTLFDFPVKEVWLEIGFGNGENLLHMAMNNPDIGFIGCEPFINGMAALCKDIVTNNVRNIRLWPDDARLLMQTLEPSSLDKCFLLNSDPWPKTRHHKRRFVQTETLDELAQLLKPNGEFRMSTDHPSLAVWELEKAFHHPAFVWTAKTAQDWRTRPADMLQTRYQKKGLGQGRDTVYLNFLRK